MGPMRRLFTVSLVLALTCLAGLPSPGDAFLQVRESETRVHLQPGRAEVSLAVVNPSASVITAELRLELLDPDNQIIASRTTQQQFRPGDNKVSVSLQLRMPPSRKKEEAEELLWHRLLYRLTPQRVGHTGAPPVEGILALGEISPDLFELSMAGPWAAKLGSRYSFYVRATHPVTLRGVPGVRVTATLELEDENGERTLKTDGITDSRGIARLRFQLPATFLEDEPDLKVVGTLGDYAKEVRDTLRLIQWPTVLLSTDKPIYQPGQTLHVRLLAFGPTRRALSDAPFVLKIHDPEDTLVFRTPLKTSRFGVASADWAIPENLRLGDYRVQVLVADESGDEDDEFGASTRVKISRYDLPAFRVEVGPDRGFYLPGQSAEVEVRADYLFGEPVPRGHARVVRESDRHWNYREQKWEVTEAQAYEGEADTQGRFVARIDLSDEHKELADEDYSRHSDLRYAAYYTDSSTGRTEQRRFSLRVTKDPIHLYVIEGNHRQAEGFPLEFYLSTFYADGTPASCEVQISAPGTSVTQADGSVRREPGRVLRSVRTNRYGVTKITGLALTEDEEIESVLTFRALDRKGAVGRHSEDFWFSGTTVLRINTDKALYRPGEPVQVRLHSNERQLTVAVDAIRDWQVLASRLVKLRNGKATVTFSTTEAFYGEVGFVAYALGPSAETRRVSSLHGSHMVLFPRDQELKVDARLSKSSFRPGEDAGLSVQVRDPSGVGAPSAVGLVVVDQAVEERARTDTEFGAGGGFYAFRSYWGNPDEIAGIRRDDLNKLDLSKPLPAGFDLAAEILLQSGSLYPMFEQSDSSEESLLGVFATIIEPQFEPIRQALEARSAARGDYPQTPQELDRILSETQIHFGELRDPWGTPYRAAFRAERQLEKLSVSSAGPDRKPETDDDFQVFSFGWKYFEPHLLAIQRALDTHHERTGGFIRDADALRSELRTLKTDFDSLRDPWGQPYQLRFGVDHRKYTVAVWSRGPDRRFEAPGNPSEDDFSLGTASIDYFLDMARQLDLAIAAYFRKAGRFPASGDELREAAIGGGVAWDQLRDPWDRAYYATFAEKSRYADSYEMRVAPEKPGEEAALKTKVEPVTQRTRWIYLHSAGKDGKEGTPDDFDVATFSRLMAEQSSWGEMRAPEGETGLLSGATGSITGVVTDPTGAVIPGAAVTATHQKSEKVYPAKTDESGRYLLRNLPAGLYTVNIVSAGFRQFVAPDVPVRSSGVTTLDVHLSIGAVAETVAVSAEQVMVQTSVSSLAVSGVRVVTKSGTAEIQQQVLLATPRLREYFPETLFWQPELITTAGGRASVKFRLADNITTWKLAIVASTVDGQLGTTEKDIRAFQPFFVEHDPPRFLTQGDEIALPVVLRNYLDRAQTVALSVEPQSWFKLLGPPSRQSHVGRRDATKESFPIRALTQVSEGKLRVVARSKETADAVERKVTVRPDGQEQTGSVGQVFTGNLHMRVQIPEKAIPGATHGTLWIYPNLLAHVTEGIEGILQRPYGCAEQTISAAYASVLYLRAAKQAGTEAPSSARARRYVQTGYERLLSYRAPGGGFSYWGRGRADVALTAHALRFLNDAQEFVAVDSSVTEEARSWLLLQAGADGTWSWRNWDGQVDTRRTALQTTYVLRVLAETGFVSRQMAAEGGSAQYRNLLARSIAYVDQEANRLNEPYLIATYVLIASQAGDATAASRAIGQLRGLAKEEAGASYWALETNTPFYGWGLAGRIETTALATQALLQQHDQKDALVNRALLFLLRNKDRYGVWFSTQATIQTLSAILRAFQVLGDGQVGNTGGPSEVVLNGRKVASVVFPATRELTGPLAVDLSEHLGTGVNTVEVLRPEGAPSASAQLRIAYYIPWPGDVEQAAREVRTDALRLAVQYDRTESAAGDQIRCTVDAERVGFRGYGMLLAEIGLPPGADVDRASLDLAIENSGWDVGQYDVLPDRLIVYLWPRAGGTKFAFVFRPRFGMDAKTPASILYDYYNPDARASVPPQRFRVQ